MQKAHKCNDDGEEDGREILKEGEENRCTYAVKTKERGHETQKYRHEDLRMSIVVWIVKNFKQLNENTEKQVW